MSEERLRWTGVAFVASIVAVLMPNVTTFFWTLIAATFLEDAADTWTMTARIRMVFPILGFTLTLAHLPVAMASVLAARAASREPDAPRLAVLTTTVLAILAITVVAVSLVAAALRWVGAELDVLRLTRDLVATVLMLTLAASLALVPRARVAGTAAMVLVIASEVPTIVAAGVEDLTWMFTSAAISALLMIAAWVAIGVALRRARPIATEPGSLASTFA